MMIYNRLDGFGEGPVVTELNNIRNAILNQQEREATFFCQTAGYICERCRQHKYKHLGSSLRCPAASVDPLLT